MRRIVVAIFLIFSLAGIAAAPAGKKKEEARIDEKKLFEEIQLLADSIALVSSDYVEPVKTKDLIYGAISGMMSTLDGYSEFLDPDSFREVAEETFGEFGGIGVEVGFRDGILTVISPMEDTPAYEAGIKAGDKLMEVEGKSGQELTLDEAVKLMRGRPGTKVKLKALREGSDKLLEFEIVRAVIKIKSVKEAKMLDEKIGYVKLLEFQVRTPGDLQKAVEALVRISGAKGLVLDLRNNPGGLLTSAVETACLFLGEERMIVYTKGRKKEDTLEFRARRKTPKFPAIKLAVLVNKGSASASEIFAGAVKDNKRGIVIGVPTFGKGSVQAVIPLRDGSALKMTTASYFTPSGKNIRDTGVDPDIIVENPVPKDDGTEGPDKQLEEAARVLEEELGKK